jgi:glycosyltransferase involved in cell wall biosynthesis
VAIKLYIQYHKNDSGKGKFISRLIPAMREFGIKCMSKPAGCDATLGVTWFREKTGGMPKILRIDGVHLNTENRAVWRNEKIEENVRRADLIIWQSEYCKVVGGKILHAEGKNCFTIFNGAPVVDLPPEHKRSQNPLMAAKWWSSSSMPRHHKRLSYHADIAHEFWKRTGITTTIAGEVYNQKPQKGEGVIYTGYLPDDKLQEVMRNASMFVYVPYFDWCPNVVVEAMANRCNVICGNVGGHAEMVAGYGTVLDIDKFLDKPYGDKHHIPQPPIGSVVDAMVAQLEKRDVNTVNPKMVIQYVAERYSEAIKSML